MKSHWISDSDDPAILSGVAIFDFDGERISAAFASFPAYHAFAINVQREIESAEKRGRNRLIKAIKALV